MNLSTLYSGFQGYYEYARIVAPNAAEDSVAANTNTTLPLDAEVEDTLQNGSLSSNTVSVPAGTYYFEAETAYQSDPLNPGNGSVIFGVYNGASRLRAKRFDGHNNLLARWTHLEMSGTFVLAATGSLTLKILSNTSGGVGNNAATSGISPAFTTPDGTTAGLDQRTTLRLWKLK